MSPSSRFPTDEDDLPQELLQLGREVAAATGPRQRELADAYEQVVEAMRRRRRILALVQEALSQLRLDIKYLMFDLEATRAERDALRKRLEGERNG
jgi:septal ring factor EnvC (AmiA/AmiB activator)